MMTIDIDTHMIDRAASAPDLWAGATWQRSDPGYRCGTCGATFAVRSRLDAHLECAYHGFQCLACGTVHATGDACEEHIQRAHPSPAVPRRVAPEAHHARARHAPRPDHGAPRDDARARRTRRGKGQSVTSSTPYAT